MSVKSLTEKLPGVLKHLPTARAPTLSGQYVPLWSMGQISYDRMGSPLEVRKLDIVNNLA